MNKRRDTLKGITFATGACLALPDRWSKPLFNSVLLPAHAQTSCSGFTTTVINEPLIITVTDTTVSGPAIATRTENSFTLLETSELDECRDDNTLNLNIEFNGTIDSANNSISGNINISQTCGGEFVCEQISTFTVSQNPAITNDNGSYSGALTGTLRCCNDF